MSESSGFFISQGCDRKYTPDWLASYIKAIITTGVFKDECGVIAADGMAVTVAPGRAWIEGYLYLLDTTKTLQIVNADGVLGRLDIVVLRLDLTARTIGLHVLTGTPSASPVAPALTRNSDVYELELAEVSVPAGTISVTQELIRDTGLDETLCGITVSAVQHIPTTVFLNQMWAGFNVWFDEVKGILGDDEAEKLLQMIHDVQDYVQISDETSALLGGAETVNEAFGALKTLVETAQSAAVSAQNTAVTARNTADAAQSTANTALTTATSGSVPVGSIFWYPNGYAPSGYLICDGSAISRTIYAKLFAVIGTAFGGGDGSTTFNLPDLRAKFVRGAGTSNAYTATFGQTQEASALVGSRATNYNVHNRLTKALPLNYEKTAFGPDETVTDAGSAASGTYPIYYYLRPYNIALTPIIKY